jgi:hypothetical protein
MTKKLAACVGVLFLSQTGQALACAVCYGAKGNRTTENMAVAIWVLMAAVMTVLGGVGAFGFHLWRHSAAPLEPHQELVEEDLAKYD